MRLLVCSFSVAGRHGCGIVAILTAAEQEACVRYQWNKSLSSSQSHTFALNGHDCVIIDYGMGNLPQCLQGL